MVINERSWMENPYRLTYVRHGRNHIAYKCCTFTGSFAIRPDASLTAHVFVSVSSVKLREL